MANVADSKPIVGTVAPVEVQPWWKHISIIIAGAAAAASTVLTVLIQLQELPGLPTNITAAIGTTIAILTAFITLYQKLYGKPMVTPTAATKLIETAPLVVEEKK